jgi:hypothetical protein
LIQRWSTRTTGRTEQERCVNSALDGWCVTDPDTRVGLLQAQTCNVRSKCRCSCVLQFTLCHAFSCVLHRPPSQLIHCTALYLRLQSHDCCCVQDKKKPFHNSIPGGIEHGTRCGWRGSLNRLRYQQKQTPGSRQPKARDQAIHGPAAQTWATLGRQAKGPRTDGDLRPRSRGLQSIWTRSVPNL